MSEGLVISSKHACFGEAETFHERRSETGNTEVEAAFAEDGRRRLRRGSRSWTRRRRDLQA